MREKRSRGARSAGVVRAMKCRGLVPDAGVFKESKESLEAQLMCIANAKQCGRR